MRCSDCFGEMVETAGILQCTTCGRVLQAIPEDELAGPSALDRLKGALPSDLDGMPVPMPILAAGGALAIITTAALVTLNLSSGGDGMSAGSGAAAAGQLADDVIDVSNADVVAVEESVWRTAVTSLSGVSAVVSSTALEQGHALVLHPRDGAGRDSQTMRLTLLDDFGNPAGVINPILPQSWLLTDVTDVAEGDHAVLGQTADGTFLFRIDRLGQPVWGRFGTVTEDGTAAASLLKAGNMLVVASEAGRERDVELVAYDLDGRRLWTEPLIDAVPGSHALTAAPNGDLLVLYDVDTGSGGPAARLMRMDGSGQAIIDRDLGADLAAVDVAHLAVDRDEAIYVLGSGAPATLKRLSPRGVEQWSIALDDIRASDGDDLRLVTVENGAVVIGVDRSTVQLTHVSRNGLEALSRTHAADATVSLLGAKVIGGDRLDILTAADEDLSLVRVIHLSGSVSEVFGAADTRPLPDLERDAGAGLDEPELRRPVFEEPRQAPATRADDAGAGENTLARIAERPSEARQPSPAPAAPPSVDCRFTCTPEDVPQAKYPVSQTYELTGGRTMDDVIANAFAAHERICLESGGAPHGASVPVCERR